MMAGPVGYSPASAYVSRAAAAPAVIDPLAAHSARACCVVMRLAPARATMTTWTARNAPMSARAAICAGVTVVV